MASPLNGCSSLVTPRSFWVTWSFGFLMLWPPASPWSLNWGPRHIGSLFLNLTFQIDGFYKLSTSASSWGEWLLLSPFCWVLWGPVRLPQLIWDVLLPQALSGLFLRLEQSFPMRLHSSRSLNQRVKPLMTSNLEPPTPVTDSWLVPFSPSF